ncbi:hypothetical protein [Kitasatospora sp. NBC_01302]|uniref:hypothetical protein n=1 Tax=Kitasatospora sp. NBC_01302 TaxID=2903575 RepID=UPI002E0D9724|nr:hypothetical protein OG294_39995 [Kitasatospora sp. NBC_01302]
MSKPTWMASHLGTQHTADPLEQLLELGRWLSEPARRLAWRTARKQRQADAIDAERAYNDAQRPSLQTPAAQITDLHEHLHLAQGRAGLLALVEELAERTRLRVTTTVLHPDQQHDLDPQALRLRATRINTGIRQLLTDLAADFAYPDEVHRTAEAALRPLTSRLRAVEATGEPDELSSWAEAIEFAGAVIQTAPTRA